MSALRLEKTTRKKRIAKLTPRLAEELSAWKRSVAEKGHMEDVVAVNENLIEQFKQLSAHVTELKGHLVKGHKTAADLNVKLKATEKRVEDVVDERDGL